MRLNLGFIQIIKKYLEDLFIINQDFDLQDSFFFSDVDKERTGHCALCANLCGDHYHVTTYIVDLQWAIDIWVPKKTAFFSPNFLFFFSKKKENVEG